MCSEAFYIGIHNWNRKHMTFPPDMVFFEFIPSEEFEKLEKNKKHQPTTVLLHELELGKMYEVIITHFYGGPLMRYRLRDIVKITSLKDEETGVTLPQFVFQRRVGETINLGGLADLDEKTIWQAIANTGVKYNEWTAAKDYDHDQSYLHIYLEPKESFDPERVAIMIDEQLRLVDTDYKDIDEYLKLQPIRVTKLTPGTFEHYMEAKKQDGAEPAHWKPAHINPSEDTIQLILQLSEANV
jgi:phenylacetate-coenzyme A ligase PaaK-like adenylate-forming protein